MNISEMINFKLSYKIILEIEENLKLNFNKIQSSIEQDNDFFGESFNLKDISKSFSLIKNENWNFENTNSDYIYTSIGNIAVIYNGAPDIAIYLILKAIKTNNNLILFEDNQLHSCTKIILNIINDVLKKNMQNLIINCKEYDDLNEIISYKAFFNKYICIGSKEKYNLLKAKLDMPIIYNAYGTLVMYIDDKNEKKTLIDIDNYVYNNNIKLDLFKGELEEDIIKINRLGHDFMFVIFSNDKEKIKMLIEKVNSTNVCLNKNPFINDYNFFIKDEEFLLFKQIII